MLVWCISYLILTYSSIYASAWAYGVLVCVDGDFPMLRNILFCILYSEQTSKDLHSMLSIKAFFRNDLICVIYIKVTSQLSHFDIGNVWKFFKAFLCGASWLIRWNKSGKEETSQPREESKKRKPLTKRGFTSEVKAGNLIYFVKTNSVEKPFETKSSEKKFQLIFRSMDYIITNQKWFHIFFLLALFILHPKENLHFLSRKK